jgi:ribosomal protein S18 acetylase RimI-like enzyme
MSGIAIRPAAEADYDAVAQVWRESFASLGFPEAATIELTFLRERIPREIANGWEISVAEEGGAIVAMLAIRPRDNHLDQIFVAPDHKGRGIGKKLLALCRTRMPDEMWLRADLRNSRAIAWYEKEGFVREEIVREPHWGGPRGIFRWRRRP